MVDFDRVRELRSRGWGWDRIAADAKVGFHPDPSVHDPGLALRGLYQRERSRARRRPTEAPAVSRRAREARESRWTFSRIGYLLTPIFAIWFALAFLVPSPIGLVLAAVPYLALALAVAAFLLVFGLWRAGGPRWSPAFRATVVIGVVLGLVISGLIALGGILFFGCPYLPSAASATSQPAGWTSVGAAPWQEGGRPVVYYYGASWCPYCSASSWAIWKALVAFDPTSPAPVPTMGYSAEGGIPEVILAGLPFSSSLLSLQVSEDLSGVVQHFPSPSNCYQKAYFNAYSGGAIPFLVVNGQFVHGGSSLLAASALAPWANGAQGGTQAVYTSVLGENGTPWQAVEGPAWWTMAILVRSLGGTVGEYAATYHWSAATQAAVSADLAQIH